MQRLTQDEAGRVTATLREAADELSLLARIPQSTRDANAAATKVEHAGFPAVSEELAQLVALEQGWKEVMRAKGRSGGGGVGASASGGEEGGSADAAADDGGAAALSAAYTDIIKLLRRVPGAAAALPPGPSSSSSSHNHAAESGGSGVGGLAASLRALVDVAVKRLATTRQGAADAKVELANKQARTEASEREAALLREELAKQRAQRMKQTADLTAQLARVKEELLTAQRLAEAELKDMHSAGTARTTQITDAHGKGEATLEASLEKLRGDVKGQTDAHIDAEANLRKRKARLRLEAETLVREYDAAMAAVQASIDDVEGSRRAESVPLADLEQYYKKVDAELLRLEEERKIAEEKYFHEVTVMNFVSRRAGGTRGVRVRVFFPASGPSLSPLSPPSRLPSSQKRRVCAKKIQRKYRPYHKWRVQREMLLNKGKKK
jgi:hypothetical protein